MCYKSVLNFRIFPAQEFESFWLMYKYVHIFLFVKIWGITIQRPNNLIAFTIFLLIPYAINYSQFLSVNKQYVTAIIRKSVIKPTLTALSQRIIIFYRKIQNVIRFLGIWITISAWLKDYLANIWESNDFRYENSLKLI